MSNLWVGVRQSVLVSVFLAYLMSFACQWIARKSKDQAISNRIRENHSYVFLFGFVSLFSSNLFQGGIYQALICWGSFISLFIMHIVHFKSVPTKVRSISRLVFTIFLFAQCFGTIVNYYV